MFLKVQSPGPGLYRSPSYVFRTAARFTIGGREPGRSPVQRLQQPPLNFPTYSAGDGKSRWACGFGQGLSCNSSAVSSPRLFSVSPPLTPANSQAGISPGSWFLELLAFNDIHLSTLASGPSSLHHLLELLHS